MCHNAIENLSLGFPKYKEVFVIHSHSLFSHMNFILYCVRRLTQDKGPPLEMPTLLESELGHMANYLACLKSDNQFSGICWLIKPWCTGKMLTVIPHADGREPLHVSSARFTFCVIFWCWLCHIYLLCHLLWLALTPYWLPLFLDFFCSVLFLVCGWSHF